MPPAIGPTLFISVGPSFFGQPTPLPSSATAQASSAASCSAPGCRSGGERQLDSSGVAIYECAVFDPLEFAATLASVRRSGFAIVLHAIWGDVTIYDPVIEIW